MTNHGLPLIEKNATALAPMLRQDIKVYLRAYGPRIPESVQDSWDNSEILQVAIWVEQREQGNRSVSFPLTLDSSLSVSLAPTGALTDTRSTMLSQTAPAVKLEVATPARSGIDTPAVDARTTMIDPGHGAESATEEVQSPMTTGDEESAAASELPKKKVVAPKGHGRK